MGTLHFRFFDVGFYENLARPVRLQPWSRVSALASNYRARASISIVCGLRDRPRKQLWKSRVLSTEAIQTVHALKLAKSTSKLQSVFNTKLTRLLKADVFDAFAELMRQNELDLAFEVFKFIRQDLGYKTELSLYSNMILLLGKNKRIELAEELFREIRDEGLEPDRRAFTEMIGAYLRVGMFEKAMDLYKSMKESGHKPDRLIFKILIRNLKKAGEEELAETIKEECYEYVDYAEDFLKEVEQMQVRKHTDHE